MRFASVFTGLTLLGSAAASAINIERDNDVEIRDEQDLFKRRGGGGGGGRGGSSGGSSGGGSRGGNGGSSGNTRPTSNQGGTSSSGSGTPRSFAGGRAYSGGAAVPYTSGRRSPGGIAPFFLAGTAIAFWPGIWLYGAHVYHYRGDDDDDDDDQSLDDLEDGYMYNFFNSTTERNETLAVLCGCSPYSVCGCDENEDTEEFLDDVVGDGSYEALDKDVATVSEVEGVNTLLLNGTLANGTTASPAPGRQDMINAAGYWPVWAAAIAAAALA